MNENKVFAIFKKLPKTQFSKQKKLELSIVSDLEDRYDELQYAFDDASYYGYERLDDLLDEFYNAVNPIKTEIDEMAINGNASNLPFVAEEVKTMIAELEQKADELGLNPSDLVAGYDDMKIWSDQADSVYSNFVSKYRETINVTNNNDFIK